MLMEALMHEHNIFATLTYNDENLPKNEDLVYRDVQLFNKNIRNALGYQPRFVNVGEYGGKKGRPHWHVIYFGLELTDLVRDGTGTKGDPLYKSEWLESLWEKGSIKIGEVNATTAGYVAKYHLKDTDSKNADAYKIIDPETNEPFARQKPKMRTSRRPGIGAPFFDVHYKDCEKGYITFDGKKHPLPKYMVDRMEKVNPVVHEKLKADREAAIQTPAYRREHTEQRMKTKENLLRIEKEKREQAGDDQVLDPTSDEFWKQHTPRMPTIAEAIALTQSRVPDPRLRSLVRGLPKR